MEERREITQNPKTRNIKKIYFQCSLFKRTCLPALPNLWLLLVQRLYLEFTHQKTCIYVISVFIIQDDNVKLPVNQ